MVTTCTYVQKEAGIAGQTLHDEWMGPQCDDSGSMVGSVLTACAHSLLHRGAAC